MAAAACDLDGPPDLGIELAAGDGAPPACSDGPMVAAEPPVMDTRLLQMVPYTSRLFLDQGLDSKWYLTDTQTHEQVRVPDCIPQPTLIIHENGQAAVVSADDEDAPIFIADEQMAKQLYGPEGGDVELIVVRHAASDSSFPITEYRRKFREGMLRIPSLVLGAATELKVYVFLSPRVCGCRCFFDTLGLYKILGLTSFKVERGKNDCEWCASMISRVTHIIDKTTNTAHFNKNTITFFDIKS